MPKHLFGKTHIPRRVLKKRHQSRTDGKAKCIRCHGDPMLKLVCRRNRSYKMVVYEEAMAKLDKRRGT